MRIWEKELERHSWSRLREASGSANEIPEALRAMLGAATADAVEVAYWKLENHVVVQGQLFEVAPYVVSVLMAALVEDSPSYVRVGILELLLQITSGESHTSEKDTTLGPQCRARASEVTWLLYGELNADLPGQRAAAIEVLEQIETDRDRLLMLSQAALE